MKILASLTFLAVVSSFSIYAEEKSVLTHGGKFVYQLQEQKLQTQEKRLLDKALLEGAVTADQKSAVTSYIALSPAEREKLVQTYREVANSSRGGKFIYQSNRVRDFKNKADRLEKNDKTASDKNS